MKRRDFLKQTAAAATTVSVPSRGTLASGQGRLERRGAPKRVLIVGAGLAGLAARTSSHRLVTTSAFSKHEHVRVVGGATSQREFRPRP
jgi:hypothetical protein